MSALNLILQSLHNLIRWAVLVLALIAIARAFAGWLGKKPFTSADRRAGMLYSMFFDVQLLLGLILYISKGWLSVLAGDFGAAMGEAGLRFFAIEHILIMLAAAVIAHIGTSSAKKAAADPVKHRRLAIWLSVSFLFVLTAIPWPFLANGRPWLRLLGIQF